MNAKQKIHQTRLSKWAALIKEQSSSGLTIREWCSRNNVSFHAYNYWKHQLKETVVDSVLPDIVPLPQVPVSIPAQHTKTDSFPASYNSRDLRDVSPMVNSSVSVCLGDVRIEIGPSAPDATVLNIIKAVRNV